MPDLPQLVDGDSAFLGVNSRLDPQMLPQNYVSEAINRVFESHQISNRWGVIRPKWGGKWSIGTQSGTVTFNSNVMVRPSPGNAIATGTIVACDETDLVFETGTRVVSDDNTNCILSTRAYNISGLPTTKTLSYYQSTVAFSEILGILKFRDPQTGNEGMLVASNENRTSDGGQGKVYLVRPNSSDLEVTVNGWDFYGPVKMVQCADSIVMMRPGNARYYFKGSAANSSTDVITLNVEPDLETGDRVILGQVGSAPPLITVPSGLPSGEGLAYYVRVVGNEVSLHYTEANARSNTSKADISAAGAVSSYRFYLELQSTTSGNDAAFDIDDYENDAMPLIMEPASANTLAIDSGFSRIPLSRQITGADAAVDTVTVPNHNMVPGDKVKITNSTGGGIPDGTYWVYPVDQQTLKLFQGDTADTDSLRDAQQAKATVDATRRVSSVTVPDGGSGYTSPPTVSFTGGGGTGAAATAVLSGNSVASITVTNQGTGYTSAPTVTLTGGGGTGATAVALIRGIDAVTITDPGLGYQTPPAVTFSGGGGSGATATSTVDGNEVSSITVTNGGTGYTSAPTVTIAFPPSLKDVTSSFTADIKKFSASGMPVPAGRDGLYFQSRLLMLFGNDYLAVSDVLDPLHYSPVVNEFKLNTGSNDRVTAIYPFNATTLIVFKSNSILAIQNLYGDLSQVAMTEVTREFGCVSANSIVGTGSDVVFLSQRGVVSLKQTEFGISQSVIVPLSDPVQGAVDQIDKASHATSCAAYFANRYILSVPINESGGANTRTLSYNFLNQAWEGYWDGTLLVPKYYERLTVGGVERLVFADESGYIHYYDPASLYDKNTITGQTYQVATDVTFRGYTCGSPDHKQWTDAHFEFASWNPTYSIEVEFDGVNEKQVLATGQTKSRTTYYKYGQPDYVVSNVNNDFLNPYREDYSTSGSTLTRCNTSGIKVGIHQVYVQKARLRRHAATVQPRVTTSQGSLNITSSKVVGIPFRLYGKTDA